MVVNPGINTCVAPEARKEPLQEPVYHFQIAPVPKIPPAIVRLVLFPGQIGEVPDAEVAAVEIVLSVTDVLTQVIELQVPTALT